MHITLPHVLKINELILGNPVRQIGELSHQLEGTLATFTRGRLQGFLFQPTGNNEQVLIIPQKQALDGYDRIIHASINPEESHIDLSNRLWLKHPLLPRNINTVDYEREINQLLESWAGAFSYVQEDQSNDVIGLRNPQIGAIHSIFAHWSTSDSPATIVMPTGTGKTEVMLSILVAACCPKLLIIVPTDALRTQIANKFLTLGILKAPNCNVLSSGAKFPIVCVLKHIPRSLEEIDSIFRCSQVIVTTSNIAGQCDRVVQDRMVQHCPYLIVDEAHHSEAPTWSSFKERFRERRILQFTATPFREDGKPVDGNIIFNYPLKKAQQEGYFRTIRFQPVIEFNRKRSDLAIASKAIEQLREDAEKGHIMMARVESVERAKQVFEIYERYPEFNPVQIHTGIKSQKKRDEIRKKIISGESKIVVCVDMLGEGFDLPELKIAAFHDIRKTLSVTLQLAGRFTRARSDLGNATFIANTADVNVQDELRKLYTQDPDWNILLPELSERMIGEQVSLQEFLRGFRDFTEEIPLKTIQAATSAVVYKTACGDWNPENFRAGIPSLNTCEQIFSTVNHVEHILVIVTVRRVPLVWTDVQKLFSWEWELYIVIWSPEQNLLFINSSTNSGEYRTLAQAIAGENATLVDGQIVFRTFSGVTRLQLKNVGLTEQLGRNVRYTGRMGADVEPALTEVQRRRSRKSVLSGIGYENGEKVTVGASRKGRIWSIRRDRVDKLAAWCKKVGWKLLDEAIDPDEVLSGTLNAKTITERPSKMPIYIDWPEEVYTSSEALWIITIDGQEFSLSELNLELVSPSIDGTLRFAISSENIRLGFELQLFESEDIPNYEFIKRSDLACQIRRGERAGSENIINYFYANPPVIWFSDGSSLEGNHYVELKNLSPAYDPSLIQAWDWTGIDIRKESQGVQKEQDSIQAKVIQELKKSDYHMIIDDDGKGEAADIVTIRVIGDLSSPSAIDLEFYHCKYSQESTPGQRIADLYELCGQAQKSIFWMSSPEKRTDLFTHLMRREARRRDAGVSSRIEVGSGELLNIIREISRFYPISLKIYVVQPGLSKTSASRDQLQLLSVTKNHLMETYQIPFSVIASI